MLEGKNLRSCAHPYVLRFVLCYPSICHPERSRSFGEAVPRQNQEPRARRDLLRPTEGYINAKNIFNHRGIGDPDTSCRPPFVGHISRLRTSIFCFAKWQECSAFSHGHRMFSVTTLFSAVSFIRDTTTHHTSLCSVASFVCKTCHLRTCEQICSLTREGLFYFASQNGKNLRSCAHAVCFAFVGAN